MDLIKLSKAVWIKGVIAGLAILLTMLMAFMAGMSVGYHKADFSYRFGDNYHKNFAGPRLGPRGGIEGKEFMAAHGTVGRVIDVSGSMVTVEDPNGGERIVAIGSDTSILEFRRAIKADELASGDNIVVIGEPDDSGVIQAKLIRIMPPVGGNGMMPPPGMLLPR